MLIGGTNEGIYMPRYYECLDAPRAVQASWLKSIERGATSSTSQLEYGWPASSFR